MKGKTFRDTERTLVTRLEDIPDFSTMSREAKWWETHDIAEDLLEGGPEVRAAVYCALGIPDPATRRGT